MVTEYLPWLILFGPLASSIFIYLFLMKAHRAAAIAALGGILTSFAGSLHLFVQSIGNPITLPVEYAYPWIKTASFEIPFGYLIDPYSILMLLVVTGVGSCIFAYSIGYMKGDPSTPRYFAVLSLFAFSMIGIVLAHNFIVLFVFWELVAVNSYLLIGFWFEKPSAADAGNKAFIVNRVADFGLLIGILYLWVLSGKSGSRSFSFTGLAEIIPRSLESGAISEGALLTAGLLIFCGVIGKSAQFPLYIWLPDAMEGPTPVSALIHAATMVAAGVYLVSRTFFVIEPCHTALMTIAVIGAVTAFMAAILALVQNDIKKILAYSTISQLGYMVLALGLGSSVAAMFHLTTHAFFKALLFLGAGAMIHSLHTQDIWQMGNLLKRMPVTAVTFLLGMLALSGLWPLSGFFSKDEILILASHQSPFLFILALVTAGLTAFYMARLVWVAILGPARSEAHAHPAPLVMQIPLLILAVFSVIGGFIGIPGFLTGGHGEGHHAGLFVPLLSSAVALAGIGLGTLLYRKPGLTESEDPVHKLPQAIYHTLRQKYYLDDVLGGLGNLFQRTFAKALYWLDLKVVIGIMVNGSGHLTRECGSLLRKLQTGRVQQYAMFFSLGSVFLVACMILKGL